jgi:toxin ParE1/3/4
MLRPLADRDIDHQFEYLAIEAGLDTAKRYLLAVKKAFSALLQNPELGSPRTLGDRRLAGLRMWPVRGFRRHLVFYIPTSSAIEVVRVLHGVRDVEGLLGE